MKASDVDHIVPREEGGADDLANLQSLCHSHHSAKTSAQNPHTRHSKPRSRLGQLLAAQGKLAGG
jgi:5-methylcytosine-specific restriction endonuclease McrA